MKLLVTNISLCVCICLSEWETPIDGPYSIICYCLCEYLGILFFFNIPDSETEIFCLFVLFCSVNQCLIYTTQGKSLLLFRIALLKAIKFSVTKLGWLVGCQVPSQATLSLPFSVGRGRECKVDKPREKQVYSLLPTRESLFSPSFPERRASALEGKHCKITNNPHSSSFP